MNCLKQELAELSFALDELRLFLDTHPENQEALESYIRLQKQREAAVNAYETCYGPLAFYQKTGCERWAWTEQPFPWEKEA